MYTVHMRRKERGGSNVGEVTAGVCISFRKFVRASRVRNSSHAICAQKNGSPVSERDIESCVGFVHVAVSHVTVFMRRLTSGRQAVSTCTSWWRNFGVRSGWCVVLFLFVLYFVFFCV